jgi:hypothetical protein
MAPGWQNPYPHHTTGLRRSVFEAPREIAAQASGAVIRRLEPNAVQPRSRPLDRFDHLGRPQ